MQLATTREPERNGNSNRWVWEEDELLSRKTTKNLTADRSLEKNRDSRSCSGTLEVTRREQLIWFRPGGLTRTQEASEHKGYWGRNRTIPGV